MMVRRGWVSAKLLAVALRTMGLLTLCACDEESPLPAPPPGADAGALPSPDEPLLDAGAFGFRRDVYPLFVQYCGECHAVAGPYHNIASPDLTEAYADSVEFAERVVARIEQGNMPPLCVFDESACVPSDALATIELWISSGMPE